MLILNLLIFNPEIGVARVGRGKVATKLGSRFFTPLLPAPLSRPPQEFCQCCPNYCFEMLLRFFLFRNVARMFLQLAPPPAPLPRPPQEFCQCCPNYCFEMFVWLFPGIFLMLSGCYPPSRFCDSPSRFCPFHILH